MSKVIMFSRVFPSYHPRKGESTYFVEKIYNSLQKVETELYQEFLIRDIGEYSRLMGMDYNTTEEKHHTIRAGHRWKAGDYFSPRVWSGKPYRSKQIIIAPDTQVKKTWDFHVDCNGVMSMAYPGQQLKYLDQDFDDIIARNDGLTVFDFIYWIAMPYYKSGKDSGPMQIICWNENIEY